MRTKQPRYVLTSNTMMYRVANVTAACLTAPSEMELKMHHCIHGVIAWLIRLMTDSGYRISEIMCVGSFIVCLSLLPHESRFAAGTPKVLTVCDSKPVEARDIRSGIPSASFARSAVNLRCLHSPRFSFPPAIGNLESCPFLKKILCKIKFYLVFI